MEATGPKEISVHKTKPLKRPPHKMRWGRTSPQGDILDTIAVSVFLNSFLSLFLPSSCDLPHEVENDEIRAFDEQREY